MECTIPFAKAGCGEHGPERRMGVLCTVLAHAGQIALDVARVVLGVIERRREEKNHSLVLPYQMVVHRVHRGPSAIGRASAREHGPTLGDGIDLTLGLRDGAERTAIVEVRATVPGAVPSVPFDRCRIFVGAMTAPIDDGAVIPRFRVMGEATERCNEEPGQPDALALSFDADSAHSVVPVARADEWKAVLALRTGVVEGAHAVLVQRSNGLA